MGLGAWDHTLDPYVAVARRPFEWLGLLETNFCHHGMFQTHANQGGAGRLIWLCLATRIFE